MAQNITLMGASYSAVPSVVLPKTGGGTASFTDVTDTTAVASDVASGKIFHLANGNKETGTATGGGGKNLQVYSGYDTVSVNTYTATDVKITVAKTGTYKVSWMGYRNTTSGTSGSQLYRTRNGTDTAIGTASTTFVNNYGQSVTLSNQSFQQGDILVVRARARNSSYVMGVGNLIIQEV